MDTLGKEGFWQGRACYAPTRLELRGEDMHVITADMGADYSFILFISEDGNWDGKCHVLRLAIPAVGYDRGRAWAKQSRHECMVAVSVS